MKQTFVLIIIFFLTGTSIPQQSKEIQSRVASATVFSNRAMVVREGSVNLTTGQYELVMANLPAELLDESVRVSGKGTADVKILDVKVEKEFTTEIQEREIRRLEQKADSLRLEDQIAADNIAILESQKNFIESLKAEAASEINKTMISARPSVNEWQQMLTFLRRNLTDIYADIRQENLKRKKLENEINTIRRTIAQTRSQRSRDYKLIRTTVLVEQPGDLKLNSSYMVNNASWHPMYDFRVSPDTKHLQISYYGMVRQSTGEDWNDVKLTLSTARPMIGQSLPELAPLYLEIPDAKVTSLAVRDASSSPLKIYYRTDETLPHGQGSIAGRVTDANTGDPLVGVNCTLEGTNFGAATGINGNFAMSRVPAGNYRLRASYIGYGEIQADIVVREKQILNMRISLRASTLELGQAVVVTAEKAPEAEREFSYSLAEVEDKRISSIFQIPAAATVPTDNAPHKVTIAMETMDVEFQYLTVPKLAESTFLKGRFVNQSPFPLLAGPVSVFMENEFVNRTHIQTVAPNETAELALGIDEAIKVSRRMINKFSESRGIFGGKKRVTFEFEIEVANTKPTEERIEVMDQLPISRNEKVKIELLSPDEREINRDKQNRITWNLALKPGAAIKLPLKYQIEFPADAEVMGLE